jgi:hypothetical protein
MVVSIAMNASAQSAVTDGLVGYWTLDAADIQGNTVKDVWGDNDGTINGDPQKVVGKVGGALEFDGDGDYIEVSSFDRSKDSEGTVEAWLKITDVVPGASGAAIFQYYVDPDNRCKFIYDIKHGGKLRFNMKLAGTWVIITDADDPPSMGTWYHSAVVQDGKTVTVYIDGEAQDSVETEGAGEWFDDLGVGTGYIGMSTTGSSWDYFKGIIDEVRIYNRALSQAEVRQNFAAQGLAVANYVSKLAISWGEIKVSK